MSDHYSSGSFPSIWINSTEPLPDTCISCGMFTDHKVKSKYVHEFQKTVAGTDTGLQVALGCLLHLLGPLGWGIATILQGGDKKNQTTEKTMKQKVSIKVPCCRLCAGQSAPVAIDGVPNAGRFAFEAHPRFVERLGMLRTEAES